MKFIKNITKKFSSFINSDPNIEANNILPELSHDLKNSSIAIRSITGNIKNTLDTMEKVEIQSKLLNIDKVVDHANVLIEMVGIHYAQLEHYSSEMTNFSILECVQKALGTYPFPSSKFVSHITILDIHNDFNVTANEHLTLHIIYCLIKNAVNGIYKLDNRKITIRFKRGARKNALCLRIPTTRETWHGNSIWGLRFIRRAMGTMKGHFTFDVDNEGYLLINLYFSSERVRS